MERRNWKFKNLEGKNTYLVVKRILDILISLFALIVLSPMFLIIAIAIISDSVGPVIFKQDRLGKNGTKFKMYKFRSMVLGAEKMGTGANTVRSDYRITRVGKIIRFTSLDELPQLINILKGDMSLIGPRPLSSYYSWKYEDYPEKYLKRFEVLPGLTGLSQINGRKELSFDEKFAQDVEYVNHLNFLLDLKIFFKTFGVVLLNKNNF